MLKIKVLSFLGIIVFLSNVIFAASSSGTLSLELIVNPKFQLEIDESTIDFGTIAPGYGDWEDNPDSDGLEIKCQTNLGKHWYFSIKVSDDLVNSKDFLSTIPASSLDWLCSYAQYKSSSKISATKINYPFPLTFQDLAKTDTTIYSSDLDADNSFKNGVSYFYIKFAEVIPADTKAGDYSTNLIFTLVEK